MKILTLKVYHHPDMDYAKWSVSGQTFYDVGLHVLQAGDSYLRTSPTMNFYSSAIDTAGLMNLVKEEDQHIPPPAPTIGISEETLLAALAITQKPELAPQLLALRKQ